MINKIINELNTKKVLILGFGREGRSTYKFIRKHLPTKKLYINDLADLSNDEMLKDDENVELNCGESYLDDLENYDIIMKTPGITLKDVDLTNIRSKISSELELVLKYTSTYTIGITGTKGKSTTSSMLYKILTDQGIKVLFAGNIGIPVFDIIDEIQDNNYLVLEMSSHQLEFIDHSPKIAAFLNIFEEHLDHHNCYDEYIEAKCNIFSHQVKGNYFLYNGDSEIIRNKVNMHPTLAKKYAVSLSNSRNFTVDTDVVGFDGTNVSINNKPYYNANSKRHLQGQHNLNNIMFVVAIAKILKLDMEKAVESINAFKPLEHRLECVGTFDGITYYNDSISTIPQATINAVETLKDVDSLIIGGVDRGVDYTILIDYLNRSNVKNLICMPNTGTKIGKAVYNKNMKVHFVDDLESAVAKAKEVTAKGSICVLSPAAASYGFFKNFEERGRAFKELIKK